MYIQIALGTVSLISENIVKKDWCQQCVSTMTYDCKRNCVLIPPCDEELTAVQCSMLLLLYCKDRGKGCEDAVGRSTY